MRRFTGSLTFVFVLMVSNTGGVLLSGPSASQAKTYGCYRIVDASSVRIRNKPYLWSRTIGYVQRGQIVRKNRKFCSIRGTWCRVQSKNISGWIGKKFLETTDC